MKVLVINAGSSSLKYQLIDMTSEKVVAKGICEKIAIPGSFIKYKANGIEKRFEGIQITFLSQFYNKYFVDNSRMLCYIVLVKICF